MKTIWGETLDPNAVLQEYPRPQMVRGSYRNLNGLWDYAITDAAAPKCSSIRLPSCFPNGSVRRYQST